MGSNLDYFTVCITQGKHWDNTQIKALSAYRRRLAIIDRLGGQCAKCRSKKNLEIDHINGRNWDLAKKSRWSRVVIYEREEKEGKLQVLCRKCNKLKG